MGSREPFEDPGNRIVRDAGRITVVRSLGHEHVQGGHPAVDLDDVGVGRSLPVAAHWRQGDPAVCQLEIGEPACDFRQLRHRDRHAVIAEPGEEFAVGREPVLAEVRPGRPGVQQCRRVELRGDPVRPVEEVAAITSPGREQCWASIVVGSMVARPPAVRTKDDMHRVAVASG
jgi:hypothetical protein